MQSARQSHSNGLYHNFGKRALDIILALLGALVFCGPVLIILFVYAFIPGFSPFFIQRRVGLHEQTFEIIKFRTLTTDASGSLQNRRFWWGDFLRFTNLDELPQLYNILKGDMSFVGPRPLPVEYLPLYSETQRIRHTVRPGITGWAQVNGRHQISWANKFELDVIYARNISFLMDLRIVIKTIVLILSFRKDYSLHEKRFTGNDNE